MINRAIERLEHAMKNAAEKTDSYRAEFLMMCIRRAHEELTEVYQEPRITREQLADLIQQKLQENTVQSQPYCIRLDYCQDLAWFLTDKRYVKVIG